jgi:hypothetical protein
MKIQINSKNQILEGKINWKRGNTWATPVTIGLVCKATSQTSKFKIYNIYENNYIYVDTMFNTKI